MRQLVFLSLALMAGPAWVPDTHAQGDPGKGSVTGERGPVDDGEPECN